MPPDPQAGAPAVRRRRTRQWLSEHQWPIIGLLWLVALVLGYIGFDEMCAASADEYTSRDVFYLVLQLFTLESGARGAPVGWELEVARLLAPAVAMWTVLQGLALIFAEELDGLRRRFLRGHVIICGLSAKGLQLAQTFQDEGYRVVAVEIDAEHDDIATCRERGIAVVVGDATQPEVLLQAGIAWAKYLLAVCDDDGVNAGIAVRCRELSPSRKSGALTCLVHIVDAELCVLLRQVGLTASDPSRFRLEFFNVFEAGARALLNANPIIAPARGEAPHLLVVGLGQFGRSLTVRAARDWRQQHGNGCPVLRVTVVDLDATPACEELLWDHPELRDVVELQPIDANVNSARFRKGEFLGETDGSCGITQGFICLDDDSTGLSAALALRENCRRRAWCFPVAVRMNERSGLSQLLETAGGAASETIDLFNLVGETCRPSVVLGGVNETLARAMHEDYFRQQLANGVEEASRASMRPWDELDEDLREANRHQAAHVVERLASFGYRIVPLTDWDADKFEFPPDQMEAMSRMEHERWMRERQESGWKFGPERNDKRKLHPDLVTYEELSEATKQKDRDMVIGLPAFLARVGFQIEKANGL